ncbi:MAG: Gx transporter family protein, partial [Desulfobacterales bacterium]|nr:Gx transporter family protein [Desulfobacterales bacterium]
GLANLLTLTTLVLLGFKSAMEVAVLRAILSSFILGTFMSPGFILSLAGAVASTLIMGFFHWLAGFSGRYRLSIIGISIIGAFCHNMVQLVLAYLLMIKHGGIFVFFPYLAIGAVATGWVVGIVAGGVCRQLAELAVQDVLPRTWSDTAAPVMQHYVPGVSRLHRIEARTKIMAVFVVAAGALMFTGFWFYLGLFIFLAALMGVSRTPVSFLLAGVRRYVFLLLAAFLLPVFFNSGTGALITVMSVSISREGLVDGAVFALRLLLLMGFSLLLVRTTSGEQMTRGFARLLSPLRHAGVPAERISGILSCAWVSFPGLWDAARRAIAEADLKKVRNLRRLLPLISRMVALLYVETLPMDPINERT